MAIESGVGDAAITFDADAGIYGQGDASASITVSSAGVGSTKFLEGAIAASMGLDDPALAGQLVIVAEFERYDLSGNPSDTLYVATTDYITKPSDTPANQLFLPVLRVPDLSQSILSNGWVHSTGSAFSNVILNNIDSIIDDEFRKDTYDIKGRTVNLKAGLKTWDYSDFKSIPSGRQRVIDILPNENEVQVSLTGMLTRPDAMILPNRYGGFANAYFFDNGAYIGMGNEHNVGLRDFTVECRFKMGAATTTSVLVSKRSGIGTVAGNAGWAIVQGSGGLLHFYLDDATNFMDIEIGGYGTYNDDEWHHLTIRVIRSQDLFHALIDGTYVEQDVDISSVTDSLSSIAHFTIADHSTHTNNREYEGSLDEVRLWYIDVDEEVSADLSTELAATGWERGLVALYQLDENSGTSFADSIVGPNRKYAEFSGTNRVDMGDICDPGSDDFTVLAWFRAESGDGGTIVSRRRDGNTSSDEGYEISLNTSGVLYFRCCDGTTAYETTLSISGGYNDDSWWCAALRVDRNAGTMHGFAQPYKRGLFTKSSTVDISGAGSFGGGTHNFRVSGRTGGGNKFTGYINWVGYVEVAMDDAAPVGGFASYLMAATSYAWEDNIAGFSSWHAVRKLRKNSTSRWWSFTDGSGTNVTENMYGNDDGTFLSTPTWHDTVGTLTTTGGSPDFVATLEGDDELKGTPKPVVLGAAWRMTPPLVDKHNDVYQYSDPAVTSGSPSTSGVPYVFAGAVELEEGVDFEVDRDLNTITLLTSQDGDITCVCRGVVHQGRWLRYPGEIIEFVLTEMLGFPSGDIDGESFDLFDELHPFNTGAFVEDWNVEQLFSYFLAPDGAIFNSINGQLKLMTRMDPNIQEADWELMGDDIEEGSVSALNGLPPPSWNIRLGTQKTWNLNASFDDGALPVDKYRHRRPFIWVSRSRDGVLDIYADSREDVQEAPYTGPTYMPLLIERMLDADAEPRQGWQMALSDYHWRIDLGDVVKITDHSRYDISGDPDNGGRQYVCIGYQYGMDKNRPTSTIQLWGGDDLPPGCPEAPTLIAEPYMCFETRFEGTTTEPSQHVTIVGGGNPDVTAWEDLNQITTPNDATGVSGRYPHWISDAFGNGKYGGIDFSVLSGSNTSCRMTHTERSWNQTTDNRCIFAWVLKRTSTGSVWLNRKSTTDGFSVGSETDQMYVELNNGSFQNLGSSGTPGISHSSQIAEPFVIIVEAAHALTSNDNWYVYVGNLSDTDGELIDATKSTPLQDNDNLDILEIGTVNDTTGGRTNFIVGAQMYFRQVTPNSVGDGGDVNDETVQNIWEYLKHYYLNGCE